MSYTHSHKSAVELCPRPDYPYMGLGEHPGAPANDPCQKILLESWVSELLYVNGADRAFLQESVTLPVGVKRRERKKSRQRNLNK